MTSTVTLWRDQCAIKTLDVTDDAVYIGRHEAIRKRKLNERDTQIPRRAARLEVAPEHVGTLLLRATLTARPTSKSLSPTGRSSLCAPMKR